MPTSQDDAKLLIVYFDPLRDGLIEETVRKLARKDVAKLPGADAGNDTEPEAEADEAERRPGHRVVTAARGLPKGASRASRNFLPRGAGRFQAGPFVSSVLKSQ
jgi:hypothetical protein